MFYQWKFVAKFLSLFHCSIKSECFYLHEHTEAWSYLLTTIQNAETYEYTSYCMNKLTWPLCIFLFSRRFRVNVPNIPFFKHDTLPQFPLLKCLTDNCPVQIIHEQTKETCMTVDIFHNVLGCTLGKESLTIIFRVKKVRISVICLSLNQF